MYTCAIQCSNRCRGETIGYRGICCECYNVLVEWGEIKKGDRFNDFPEWLQDMIRVQDTVDHYEERHPTLNFEELELEEGNLA
jgi:hypothetical protein